MLNPVCRQYRIIDNYEAYEKAQATGRQLKDQWERLNYSGFSDQGARRAVIGLVDPRAGLFAANYLAASLRMIHDLTDLGSPLSIRNYMDSGNCPVVAEIAQHRLAITGSAGDLINYQTLWIYRAGAEKLRDTFYAVLEGRYRPNPGWLSTMNLFTRDLLVDIARSISAQIPRVSTDAGKILESTLVAAAIVKSQGTFDRIHAVISQTSSELADRIREDRRTFLEKRFAYHFTKESHLSSISEKGLSSQFSPPGCEQPEAICFNDAHNAGIEHLVLGLGGYYVKEYLLRVPIEEPLAGIGRQIGAVEELGDLTADYVLYRKYIIPPEKIEIVHPLIATRAIPLVIT
jgi:hypothetical protein